MRKHIKPNHQSSSHPQIVATAPKKPPEMGSTVPAIALRSPKIVAPVIPLCPGANPHIHEASQVPFLRELGHAIEGRLSA